MLLAGTKTDTKGFGWRHLNELLADPLIAEIVSSGLSERERAIADYCARLAYSFDHDGGQPAYHGSGANIAACLSGKFFGQPNNDHDYGSPYTTHDDCRCETCKAVRRHNARIDSPFRCRQCGRNDDSTNSKPSAEQWVCDKCRGIAELAELRNTSEGR